jgi:8-amino-7-oxononanoate synthase
MNVSKWEARLEDLRSRHLERKMLVTHSPVSPIVKTDDGEKLGFCSNDYLGLANHPAIKKAMADGALKWGAGAASSRLISGNTTVHEKLQEELARFMGTERSIFFPSGYQANVGTITALTRAGDVIFTDELIHASLIDGCRLSKGLVRIFRHGDLGHLKELLARENGDGLKLIVTDAIFSMDGDIADLHGIVAIAKETGALVCVDEAHSLGVEGPGGRGLTVKLGLEDEVAVRIGTFGKAFGVCGAVAACGSTAAGLIESSARSLLFTTATPVPVVEAIRASTLVVEDSDDRRLKLQGNIGCFRNLASKLKIPLLKSSTAIQPILVGSPKRVMKLSKRLWDRGLFVQGIRPPTVPADSARLRVTITATHSESHMEKLAVELARLLKEE